MGSLVGGLVVGLIAGPLLADWFFFQLRSHNVLRLTVPALLCTVPLEKCTAETAQGTLAVGTVLEVDPKGVASLRLRVEPGVAPGGSEEAPGARQAVLQVRATR